MIPASLTIVLCIVLAPGAVFALAFLQPLPGVAAAALALASAVATVLRTDWRGRPQWRLLAAAGGLAAGLCLLSGVGHVFWQTDDWTVRDAILFDLVRNPWPVPYFTQGAASQLRAPLGMYLVPALIGKGFGAGAAEAALLVQNSALFGLCLYIFARSMAAGRARRVALFLFVAFSGVDLLPWAMRRLQGFPDLALPHLEAWSGYFQYSSHVTQLFWVPHHALAGWAVVAAYQTWRTGRLPALLIGPVWAASLFWSPLTAAGAIPFLIFAFVCDVRDGKLRIGDLASAAAAGLAALPAMVYLTRDSGAVEKGLIDFADLDQLQMYGAFIAVEVLPYLALAWHGRDRADSRSLPELSLLSAVLVAIPVYKLGFVNDFAMRASIPALAILCLRAVPAVAALGVEPVGRRIQTLAIVALGAATPAVEIVRNLTQAASPPSACNVVESLSTGPYAGSPLDYYVAASGSFDAVPGLFRRPTGAPLTVRTNVCWPGRRFVYEAVPAKK